MKYPKMVKSCFLLTINQQQMIISATELINKGLEAAKAWFYNLHPSTQRLNLDTYCKKEGIKQLSLTNLDDKHVMGVHFLFMGKQLHNIDRRLCKMKFEGKWLLCIPNGYFAGNAFTKGLDIFEVIGTSFGIISLDDMGSWKENKHRVYEVTDHEILELLKDDRLCQDGINKVNDMLKNPAIRPTKLWRDRT